MRFFQAKTTRRPKIKPKVFGVGWALGLGILVFIFSFNSFINSLELKIFDSMMRLRPERKINPAIQVVEIDDNSIDSLGRWPWPRGYHASFLQILSEFHPKAIGYDILFSEPNLESPEEDLALAKKTQDLDSVIYPAFFVISDQNLESKNLKTIPQEIQDKFALDYKISPRDRFLKAYDRYYPIPILAKACFGIGLVNVPADLDGAVRRLPLVIEFQDRLYASFDLVVIARYLDVSIKDVKVSPPNIILYKDSKPLVKIPIDEKGQMLINYAGGFNSLSRISFQHVILAYDQLKNKQRPIIELKDFKDKIILVGLSATGTTDIRATAFSENFPGVGIHANAINNILNRDFIIWTGKSVRGLIILIVVLILGFLVPRLHPLKSLFFTLLIGIIYILFCASLFSLKNIWVGILSPLLAIIATYLAVVINQFLVSRFENQLMQKELTIASQIQQGMLPHEYPQLEGLDFYCLNKPAKFVGGDLYDFFLIDKDILAIAIGDVSGKGVPGALFMTKILTHLRSAVGFHIDPGRLFSYLNERLIAEGSSGMFLTLLYLVVNLKDKTISFSNAGHHTMLWLEKNKDRFKEFVEEKAMPIGVMLETKFLTSKVIFSSGDTFILFTDGIIEAVNKVGKDFGMESLEELILENPTQNAKDLTSKIIQDVDSFSQGLSQHDDMTTIVLKIK